MLSGLIASCQMFTVGFALHAVAALQLVRRTLNITHNILLTAVYLAVVNASLVGDLGNIN